MSDKKNTKEVEKTKEKGKIITKNDENELIKFINELPTKYGLPLLNFLNNLKES